MKRCRVVYLWPPWWRTLALLKLGKDMGMLLPRLADGKTGSYGFMQQRLVVSSHDQVDIGPMSQRRRLGHRTWGGGLIPKVENPSVEVTTSGPHNQLESNWMSVPDVLHSPYTHKPWSGAAHGP